MTKAKRKAQPKVGALVQVRGVESAHLFLTIGPGDPLWSEEVEIREGWGAGTFIRVQPPAEASDADIERLRTKLKGAGCSFVVHPRPRVQVVTNQAKVKHEVKSIRATVLTMVEEANTKDRGALLQVVEETLATAGL